MADIFYCIVVGTTIGAVLGAICWIVEKVLD